MNASAELMWQYAKTRLASLDLPEDAHIRVNKAGCLGRCSLGPTLVIYPEGVWYTYASEADIDEILEHHVLGNSIVSRLLMDK